MAQHPNAFVVAQTFFMRGIIERWGRGTNRIVEETLEAGLAEPDMIDSRLAFTVRFVAVRAEPEPIVEMPEGLSGIQREIVLVLRNVEEAPLREILALLPSAATRDQVRKGLAGLKTRGIVDQHGETNRSRWRLSRQLGPTGAN